MQIPKFVKYNPVYIYWENECQKSELPSFCVQRWHSSWEFFSFPCAPQPFCIAILHDERCGKVVERMERRRILLSMRSTTFLYCHPTRWAMRKGCGAHGKEKNSPFHALHNLSVLPSYTMSDADQITELTRSIMTDDTHTFRDNLRSGVGILGRDTLVTCEAHHGFTTTASSDGKHTTDAFVEHFWGSSEVERSSLGVDITPPAQFDLVDILLSVEWTSQTNLFTPEYFHPLAFQKSLCNKSGQASPHVPWSINEDRLLIEAATLGAYISRHLDCLIPQTCKM